MDRGLLPPYLLCWVSDSREAKVISRSLQGFGLKKRITWGSQSDSAISKCSFLSAGRVGSSGGGGGNGGHDDGAADSGDSDGEEEKNAFLGIVLSIYGVLVGGWVWILNKLFFLLEYWIALFWERVVSHDSIPIWCCDISCIPCTTWATHPCKELTKILECSRWRYWIP